MPPEPYISVTVECTHCKTKQLVRVSTITGGARLGIQIICCINCNAHFNLSIPDRIINGPFPA